MATDDGAKPEIVCYLHDIWQPLIRPASPRREWMDETTDSFAYRCLPLNVANMHGWEVLSRIGCQARWSGGSGTDAVTIVIDSGSPPHLAPVSIFGEGILTFHVEGLFRTPPGWNLWIGGSPNHHVDGVVALNGLVETDWSPFTFTMNWRFTRPGRWVRFEVGDPICFFFPVQRHAVEDFAPRFAPMSDEPGLKEHYDAWSAGRSAFNEANRRHPPRDPADHWQRHYYRGTDIHGCPAPAHQTKLRVAPFAPVNDN